ncbi:hypothetical protein L207DRAFT_419735 [Hyaloscypha variabilis F]|uniref:RTA1-domain-containing protein n=1 Tax=Hyaloscypha variabilis (strain UAMH 11265 / GT02V1 / F) TaxID=1149755 RepID=A0A2J6S4H5_HYAVF|nr:hypothetical protein L207DRAFT_419735 [Hyaloscypha variabilis F]
MEQYLLLWWELSIGPSNSVGLNIFFAIVFAFFLSLQLHFLRLWRTWSYSSSMIAGLALEVGGYGTRATLHYYPLSRNLFLATNLCLTIAPIFFLAAIYLVLARMIVRYEIHDSFISPRGIFLIFTSSDTVSTVLQSVGVGIAILAPTWTTQNLGLHLLLAGVCLQVVSLLIFIYFMFGLFKNMGGPVTAWRADRDVSVYARQSYGSCCSLYFSATVLILIRSAYRIALYARGFDGDVATDQRLFGTFETAAMFVALLKMTASPPGWFMGREGWKLDGWDEKRWEVIETYGSQSSTLGRGGEESDTFRNGQLPPPCEA